MAQTEYRPIYKRAYDLCLYGNGALTFNDDGASNTAVGDCSLEQNDHGVENSALGASALAFLSGASNSNTALGSSALANLFSGVGNIAVGRRAGQSLTSGSRNIYVDNAGASSESNTIRIGNSSNQFKTFIAGIRGVTTGIANGITVFIDSNGQLGTASSSRRFKTDIRDMADASSKLMQLRPVTFRYKAELDPSGTRQFGLIAEEVEKVMPDLVTYDKNGKIETVKYHLLAALLLNEMQKQAAHITAQERTMKAQAQQIERLSAQTRQASAQAQQIDALTARLIQLEASVSAQGHDPTVAASYKKGAGL